MTITSGDDYPVGRSLAGLNRANALLLVTVSYVVAGIAGGLTVRALPVQHPIAAAFWADIVATLVVFGLSMAVGNSSLYDPYWSVAPPVITVAWLAVAPSGLDARQLLVVTLIAAWAVRLTANWLSGWRGLSHEDWRYVQLRENRGRMPWWLLSLTGIQLVPTLVVFVGMLSVWPALTGTRPLGWLDALAVLVTGGALVLETVADIQLHRFTGEPANRGKVAEIGLWRWSRHPNYVGEIGIWWGLWLFAVAAAPDWWWTVVGPLTMVALFVGISIPLMERRSSARRVGYARAAPPPRWPRRHLSTPAPTGRVGEADHADDVQIRVTEREVGRGTDHGGDVLSGVERLAHELAADATTGSEDCDSQRLLLASARPRHACAGAAGCILPSYVI